MTNSFQISISKVYLFATYDFLNVGKRIAQQILGTEWTNVSRTLGNGNNNGKSIPHFWGWDWKFESVKIKYLFTSFTKANWKSESVTEQPTYQLIGVGARDACMLASKSPF